MKSHNSGVSAQGRPGLMGLKGEKGNSGGPPVRFSLSFILPENVIVSKAGFISLFLAFD